MVESEVGGRERREEGKWVREGCIIIIQERHLHVIAKSTPIVFVFV